MSLPRTAARAMLAALFIEGGIRQLRDPESHAAKAEPVTRPVSDAVDPLPNETTQMVRIDGAVKLAGGVLMIGGPLHRPAALALAGSLVPTTLAGHRFWEETDPAVRREQQIHFMKNLGLLGGLLVTALDTGPRPSVPYMARQLTHRAADNVTDSASSAVGAGRDAAAEAAAALVAAAGALGTVARKATPGRKPKSRRQKIMAALPVGARRRRGDAVWDDLRHGAERVAGRAAEAASRAADRAPDVASRAADRASYAASVVADHASDVASRAADRAPDVAARARHAAAVTADRAAEVASRAADRASDLGSRAADRASEVASRAADRAPEVAARARQATADAASRAADRAADAAAKAAAKAADRAHDAGDKAQDAARSAKHRVLSRR